MKTYIYVIKIKTCHNMECLKLVKIKYILKSKLKEHLSYIARLKKKLTLKYNVRSQLYFLNRNPKNNPLPKNKTSDNLSFFTLLLNLDFSLSPQIQQVHVFNSYSNFLHISMSNLHTHLPYLIYSYLQLLLTHTPLPRNYGSITR